MSLSRKLNKDGHIPVNNHRTLAHAGKEGAVIFAWLKIFIGIILLFLLPSYPPVNDKPLPAPA